MLALLRIADPFALSLVAVARLSCSVCGGCVVSIPLARQHLDQCSGSASAPHLLSACLPNSSSVSAWSHRVLFLSKKISNVKDPEYNKNRKSGINIYQHVAVCFPLSHISPFYYVLLYLHVYILVWF